MRSRFITFAALFFLTFIIVGCSLGGNDPQINNENVDPLTARLKDVKGTVSAKQPGDADYSPAVNGLVLQSGGELLTGDDGRARLDFSDGTILRVGPSSHLTLESAQRAQNGVNTKINLTAGNIWILLTSGALEVDTPSGQASVRGSYLSVEIIEGGVRVTCLEGDCSLGNKAGKISLVAGQAAVITNAQQAPQQSQMTEDDFNEWLSVNPEATVIIPAVTATQQAIVTATPTPQATSTPVVVGPDQDKFPKNFNPLTGQPVADESTLDLPAMLLSISNFPAIARPQGGLSFADFVYEFTITAGENRFLGVFYGDFPKPEAFIQGGCEVRTQPFVKTAYILGNRVWFDANKNGVQDIDEHGIAGICVNLYDESGRLIQQTTTDTNGFYGFNVEAGTYSIEFLKPEKWAFTESNLGNDDQDSDADQTEGRIEAISVSGDSFIWDAGLIPLSEEALAVDPKQMPKAEVGPIRSGRIFYAYFAGMYQNSCLVYAFASSEVLEKIPQCAMVAHEDAGGGSMMSIERMIAVANDNEKADTQFNYASNLYTTEPPSGGAPANQINVFWANLNQAGWTYDPLYGAYLRFSDKSDKKEPGVLYPATDRLTGRQLAFENFIVLFADHTAISPTIIDIDVNIGAKGNALLFRDGQVYQIRWSTEAGDYEKQSGKRRPIRFINLDGSPAALKPGHTWVMMVTPYSLVEEKSPGVWRVRYYRADGEATGAE